nr:ATP synthase F0 subunit 8 [Eurhadina acapitata]
MPQMAPMWWTLLMTTFLLSMMICMNITYFNMNKTLKNSKKKIKTNFSWMW